MTDKMKSIIAMLISALGFSFMGLFIKLTGDIPVIQKVMFRSYIILIVTFLMMRYYKVSLKGIKNHKWLLLRSFLGTIGILLNFYAVDHLLLSDATIIFRLSTFFLLFFSWVFLGERMKWEQLLTVLIAFIGVLFVVKPQFDVKMIPYLVAILGALFASGAYTVVRILSNKEAPLVIVFYFAGFSSVLLTPVLAFYFAPMTISQVVYAVLAGVSGAIGQVGVTYAYKHAPAKEVSIYNYFGVIFSALLGFFAFETLPDGYSFLGYVIIFASGYYMYKMNNGKIKLH